MCSTCSRARRATASTASRIAIGDGGLTMARSVRTSMMATKTRMRSGFTLIELLVVMAIIAVLLSIAVPRYFGSLDRSREAVLKEDLYQMRDAIGKYYGDKGRYP